MLICNTMVQRQSSSLERLRNIFSLWEAHRETAQGGGLGSRPRPLFGKATGPPGVGGPPEAPFEQSEKARQGAPFQRSEKAPAVISTYAHFYVRAGYE